MSTTYLQHNKTSSWQLPFTKTSDSTVIVAAIAVKGNNWGLKCWQWLTLPSLKHRFSNSHPKDDFYELDN
ncbi:hypothetical protein IQ276_037570 [Desmonostoc muscorum LEGE 12446]|uniref:Uncharacterized protein n=1 Tax=Desmonostoc muscorum LEGE 12446 TaxID=1828758 RepID=A0A8J7A360_DESMC|nr:hypothetical protein [Desmonostoc muscorum]MCF2152019.1 hypothetical protein [Desmonostoc muscorum LEGE 12446]